MHKGSRRVISVFLSFVVPPWFSKMI